MSDTLYNAHVTVTHGHMANGLSKIKDTNSHEWLPNCHVLPAVLVPPPICSSRHVKVR